MTELGKKKDRLTVFYEKELFYLRILFSCSQLRIGMKCRIRKNEATKQLQRERAPGVPVPQATMERSARDSRATLFPRSRQAHSSHGSDGERQQPGLEPRRPAYPSTKCGQHTLLSLARSHLRCKGKSQHLHKASAIKKLTKLSS